MFINFILDLLNVEVEERKQVNEYVSRSLNQPLSIKVEHRNATHDKECLLCRLE